MAKYSFINVLLLMSDDVLPEYFPKNVNIRKYSIFLILIDNRTQFYFFFSTLQKPLRIKTTELFEIEKVEIRCNKWYRLSISKCSISNLQRLFRSLWNVIFFLFRYPPSPLRAFTHYSHQLWERKSSFLRFLLENCTNSNFLATFQKIFLIFLSKNYT